MSVIRQLAVLAPFVVTSLGAQGTPAPARV
jgi:hypothetical protein